MSQIYSDRLRKMDNMKGEIDDCHQEYLSMCKTRPASLRTNPIYQLVAYTYDEMYKDRDRIRNKNPIPRNIVRRFVEENPYDSSNVIPKKSGGTKAIINPLLSDSFQPDSSKKLWRSLVEHMNGKFPSPWLSVYLQFWHESGTAQLPTQELDSGNKSKLLSAHAIRNDYISRTWAKENLADEQRHNIADKGFEVFRPDNDDQDEENDQDEDGEPDSYL